MRIDTLLRKLVFTFLFFISLSSNSIAQKSSSDFVFSIYTGNPGYTGGYNYYLYLDTNYTYNFDVDWENDGVFDDTAVTSSIFHQYSSLDTFQIRIRGKYPRMFLGRISRGSGFYLSDHNKLISIDQWGDQEWEYVEGAFRGCEYLISLPLDTPDFSNIRSLSAMFIDASSMNGQLNHWQVDSIISMSAMFHGASSFNQPLDKWDVSSVKHMNEMFYETDSFNQALNNWDLRNLESIDYMFGFAKSFNQPLDQWSFPKLRDLSALFYYAESFNQPLANWDVSQVTGLWGMFNHATSFNQNINSWDVSNVQGFSTMFFNAVSFNQPLNNWDLSSASQISEMFFMAESFNQPLDNWDVSKVESMYGVFAYAKAFDQELHHWDYSSLGFMTLEYFLDSSGLSVKNYDSLLFHLQENHMTAGYNVLGAKGLNYCEADSVRSLMINASNSNGGWRIQGDSLNCTVSIAEHDKSKNQFHLYPNPATNVVNVIIDKPVSQESIQLYNLQGMLIGKKQIERKTFQMDLSDKEAGIYFIKYGRSTRKLLIQD